MDDQRARDEIDTELLRQLRDGDFARAWAAIEKHYGQMMLATATAKLGFFPVDSGTGAVGAWSATDVVQQIFVELMRRGRSLVEDIDGPLGAYLRGAVRNRVMTAFEKYREIAIDDEIVESGSLGAADFVDTVVDDQVLASALETLVDRDRHVVVQTVMHLRSNAEVGRELGITGQGVGKIKCKALAQLATFFGGERP